ncbi:hypothetical protein XH99_06480 [Bradyrhizobium nanningense]|uniref:Uncharacterized protein n=1 Tax=Bradyrhizobium nanningense TaxID=1325118 RepID=A0A4Q0SD11_9BRAD|nr:hypothetical protein XH99_06480 [Bradyrhizobium nanningense]
MHLDVLLLDGLAAGSPIRVSTAIGYGAECARRGSPDSREKAMCPFVGFATQACQQAWLRLRVDWL